jgi:small-conductance mechanosensitive channel
MGGICMYWFTYYLTKSFWGSILAGFIFTFSNYHFMDADQHLQLTALEWIPLFILLWYCLITRPNPAIAVGAAIGLWMVILCDYYYFFYCGVMAAFIFIWYAVINKNILFMVRKKTFPVPGNFCSDSTAADRANGRRFAG